MQLRTCRSSSLYKVLHSLLALVAGSSRGAYKEVLGLQYLLVALPQLTIQQHLTGEQATPNLLIRTVAVCAGSGSSLLDAALSAGADLFLTGVHLTSPV